MCLGSHVYLFIEAEEAISRQRVIDLSGLDTSILDLSSEDFDATIKTNIYAPFWMIKAALPHLKPGAVILATTLEQAYDPSPDPYDYAQTKAATTNYMNLWPSSSAQRVFE